MKIAFVNQPFDGILPPHQNSIGLWTYHVVRHLPASCEALIYAKRTSSQGPQHDGAHTGFRNAQMRYVTSLPNRHWARLSAKLARFHTVRRPTFAATYHYLDYISQIALALRNEAVDIVHIHNFSQFVPVVRGLNPHAKIVLHMNGEWLSQLDPKLIEPRIRQADAVFGSSNHITELVRRAFPQHADRCHTVYNGVDSALFSPSNDASAEASEATRRRLIFVGRVSPEKGIHILLDAFKIVAQHEPAAQLDIIGPIGALPKEFLVGLSEDGEVAALGDLYEGDYFEHLQRRIPAELTGRVAFLGPVSQTELPAHYRTSDLLVNPSFSESFGMSLVEAMACAKTVVATRVGGMPEIVLEGKTGLLVERNQTAALADAMLCVLSNPDLRRTMGQEGHRRMLELFSWQRVTESALQHYDRILA